MSDPPAARGLHCTVCGTPRAVTHRHGHAAPFRDFAVVGNILNALFYCPFATLIVKMRRWTPRQHLSSWVTVKEPVLLCQGLRTWLQGLAQVWTSWPVPPPEAALLSPPCFLPAVIPRGGWPHRWNLPPWPLAFSAQASGSVIQRYLQRAQLPVWTGLPVLAPNHVWFASLSQLLSLFSFVYTCSFIISLFHVM